MNKLQGTLGSSQQRRQVEKPCTWSSWLRPAHGCLGRANGLKSSLGSYCQGACLGMEEGVPFSHKGVMCVPGSPGPNYRPRTHSYSNISSLIKTGIDNYEKGGESREGVKESDREGGTFPEGRGGEQEEWEFTP